MAASGKGQRQVGFSEALSSPVSGSSVMWSLPGTQWNVYKDPCFCHKEVTPLDGIFSFFMVYFHSIYAYKIIPLQISMAYLLGQKLIFWNYFIYLFLAVLGLHCWVGFSLVAENGGYSRVAVHEVLIEVVSLSSEHGLKGAQASAIAAYVLSSCISWVLEHRLNSCGVWASLLHIMWGLPTSGIEPMSPLLAGGLFTTELPGKLPNLIFFSGCLISLKHLTALTIDYPLGPGNLFPQLHSYHLPLDFSFSVYYFIKCSHQNLNLSIKFRILLCTSEKIEYRKQLYSVFGKQTAQDWFFWNQKRVGANLYTVRRDDVKSQPWHWERLTVGGEGGDRGWDGWMASPTRWTWVWVSSRSWWWTGRPGVLQSMGSQRVRHVTSVKGKTEKVNVVMRQRLEDKGTKTTTI